MKEIKGLIQALTKKPQKDFKDNKMYWGIRIGDRWYNVPQDKGDLFTNNILKKGQEVTLSLENNKVASILIKKESNGLHPLTKLMLKNFKQAIILKEKLKEESNYDLNEESLASVAISMTIGMSQDDRAGYKRT